MKILILSNQEVLELLPMDECIVLMREALIALAAGEVHQPLRTIIRPPDANGVMGLMPAMSREVADGVSDRQAAFGLKAVCVFPGNPAQGKDDYNGLCVPSDLIVFG